MPVGADEPSDDVGRVQRILEQRGRCRDLMSAGDSRWSVLYESWDGGEAYGLWSCMLSPKSLRSDIRSGAFHPASDFGLPGFVESSKDGSRRQTYLRYGDDSGLEPLVIFQDHYGMRPNMLPQVSEEFRLYHNLWVNEDGTALIKINMDGSDEVAVEIGANRVRARTKYLRQFQAGRQLDLVFRIHSFQFVSDRDELAEAGDLRLDPEWGYMRLSIHTDSGHGYGSYGVFSRLDGRKVIEAPDLSKAGIWPFDGGDEDYPDFVIGEGADGEPIKHTCDPEQLADHFGKNPDAPQYLTPVCFDRDVLQRYYELPEKYEVEDGYLRCGSLWGLSLDNNHPQHVIAFLGDLGSVLPESERYRWRGYNIAPTRDMSPTAFSRFFEAEPADPEAADLRFKSAYARFKTKWSEQRGWSLFRDPEPDDEHVLQRLRIPLNNSQPEFEHQLLGLAKLLVDALHEKELLKQLPDRVEGERGISKLERWMDQEHYPSIERDIAFLRRLQQLRSRIAAHRKGSDYQDLLATHNVNRDRIQEITTMLSDAERLLYGLAAHFGIDLEDY